LTRAPPIAPGETWSTVLTRWPLEGISVIFEAFGAGASSST